MQGLTIYRSSAGSGKTYTLVQEYLRIVLVNPWDYKHVLAVTFTNKATDEMKSRIIDTLSRLATTPPEELTKDSALHQEMQAELESRKVPYTVREQAGKVLRLILNDYSNFSVSTIESFFQRIVRAFARELGIPLGYDVEMQQDVVLQRIVDEMYMDIGPDKRLTQLFVNFLEGKLEEERGWNVDTEIKNLGREIFKEQFQRLAKAASGQEDQVGHILELAGQLWGIRSGFEQKMISLAEEAFEIMDSYGLAISDFKYGGASAANHFQKILKGDYAPANRARTAAEDRLIWYKPKDAIAYRIEQALDAGLPDLMQRAVAAYDDEFPRYHTARHVLTTLYSFGVLNDLQHKLSEYRKEHNQLIISDTNFLLHPFVRDQDTPFIYEKVGTRYDYYLLDEFQDTSDMQWLNLRPLLAEALGQGNGGLIVGDAKQSIYRWRNGNMELILQEVKAQMRHLYGQEVAEKELRDNWRSSGDIVAFNNALFLRATESLADTFEGAHQARFYQAYQDVSQRAQKMDLPGFAAVDFFPHRGNNDPPEVPGWQDLALTRTGELIHELMEEGFHGNQIVLLVRSNKEGVKIAEYLQQQHIKVVSNESLLIASHPRVLFLEAVLRHLNHEGDAISRAALAYYHRLTTGRTDVDHTLFDTASGGVLSAEFEAAKADLRQLPVYECVEKLCRLFPLLLEANAYVQGLLDAVLEYSSSQDASISGFLSWWGEVKSKRAIAAATERDAVQIMTIHKAKGLEFPVVIVPFADWEISPSYRDVLWLSTEGQAHPFDRLPYLPVKSGASLGNTLFSAAYDEEKLMTALDNLNLLYVAFTRAQTRLYACTQDMDGKSKGGRLASLLNEVVSADALPGQMFEDPRRFESGTIEPPVPEAEAAQQADTLDMPGQMVGQSDWDRRMRVRFTFDRYPIRDILQRSEKVDVGQLLHDALSFVQTGTDIPDAVERMFLKGYLQATQKSTLQHQLESVLKQPQAADWYSGAWEVRNEASIIGPDGQLLRPDRVMIRDGEAVVVDYKTGGERPEHRKQVGTYVKALGEIGYVPVTGYVYYIGSGQVYAVE